MGRHGGLGMFSAVGRFVVHHPVWVILAWVAVAAAVLGAAPRLTTTTDEVSFLPARYESVRAAELQRNAFPEATTPAALVVFARRDTAPLTDADVSRVAAISQGLAARRIDGVVALTPTPPSPNRQIQVVAVQLTAQRNPGDRTQTRAVRALRDALRGQLVDSDLRAGVTGTAAQALDAERSGDRANTIIGAATIGLILALLLAIFRSPIIALLPVLTIGVISQIATGLIAWANDAFDLRADSSVSAILIVVLFGVGTDYILFLMFRYRERLRLGEDPRAAMTSAVERAGEAISSAAGAVVIAFLALTLSTLGLFRSLGPALAIAVATTLVAGLTLVPAVVSLLGTRVFWPSNAWRREPRDARFAALGRSLGRRPAWYAAASGATLVVLAVFALGFHPNFDLSGSSTATGSESSVWSRELRRGLPAGATEPSYVLLRADTGTALPADRLDAYRAELARVPGVGQVGPPTLSADRTVANFQVTLADPPQSAAALRTVRGPLRAAAHAAAPEGTSGLVGGVTAVFVDIRAAVNRDYAVVFPVAALLIMVILGLLLRSLVAPWYLIATVGLGFAATLGATVLVFQTGLGEDGLIFILPVVMYLFVVALGTDYNILMVARLREEAREGRTPREAAALAVRHAGPTVAAAGLILAGTFASLMLADNSTLTQLGFATAVGIAVVAFVMSLLLTPGITALLGHTAWWPGHQDVPAAGRGAHRRGGRTGPAAA